MCFTGVIFNPYRKQIPELVVKRLHREITENPHGFYVCAANPEVYVRTLDIDEFRALFSKLLSQRPLAVHFHFRYEKLMLLRFLTRVLALFFLSFLLKIVFGVFSK